MCFLSKKILINLGNLSFFGLFLVLSFPQLLLLLPDVFSFLLIEVSISISQRLLLLLFFFQLILISLLIDVFISCLLIILEECRVILKEGFTRKEVHSLLVALLSLFPDLVLNLLLLPLCFPHLPVLE
jgi:hypothetical protein